MSDALDLMRSLLFLKVELLVKITQIGLALQVLRQRTLTAPACLPASGVAWVILINTFLRCPIWGMSGEG
ncbi:hypothetical protein PLA107_035060 (plasmid) [Pseudomonas amygdali pv. lachrymans str. M301315]|uniref:Uncharacterized protein n=1 Tax=Pseudomonas amygdali pv. lachrymans str. M301315 TaxID=629260 RepID=A0AAD0PX78_PSEAV|nr:hypothetical protein PLA107_035060 [Pseudomonas amygdali pv. lachrymans str. M301315]